MAQITKLRSALLAKALGLRETGELLQLADLVLPVISIEPFLLEAEGASPAALGAGLQPTIVITTGFESVAASATDSGVLEVFGAALVSGTDPAAKDFSHANPPNRDYEIWGISHYMRSEKAAIQIESEAVLQLDLGTTLAARRIAGRATHRHTGSAHQEESTAWVIFPHPFQVPRDSELYFRWRIVNGEAAVRSAEVGLEILWKYA